MCEEFQWVMFQNEMTWHQHDIFTKIAPLAIGDKVKICINIPKKTRKKIGAKEYDMNQSCAIKENITNHRKPKRLITIVKAENTEKETKIMQC